MLATGEIDPQTLISMDFSGVSEGKRIMGICNYNIALQCKTDENLIWEVPDEWRLEDAATVPLVYSMVIIKNKLYFTNITVILKR